MYKKYTIANSFRVHNSRVRRCYAGIYIAGTIQRHLQRSTTNLGKIAVAALLWRISLDSGSDSAKMLNSGTIVLALFLSCNSSTFLHKINQNCISTIVFSLNCISTIVFSLNCIPTIVFHQQTCISTLYFHYISLKYPKIARKIAKKQWHYHLLIAGHQRTTIANSEPKNQ